MVRRKTQLASEGIAERLKLVRQELGLSQRKVSELAELSQSGAQMVEDGRGRYPHVDTVEKLADALRVSKCWFAFGEGPMTAAFRWWVDPAFDPIQMHCDLLHLLNNGDGGHIEQSFKYMDTAGAYNWLSFVRQADYAATVDSMPLRDIALRLNEISRHRGVDIIGLGSGTAVHEVRLVNHMLSQGHKNVRLFLLDISQPLLAIGYKYAREQLGQNGNVSVWALQGDFHRLASYSDVFRSPDKRLRVFCMFGGTFGNLVNEVRFLEDSLSQSKNRDLLLFDVSLVRAPVDQTKEVMKRDPALNGTRPLDYQRRAEHFLSEPIRRHLHDVELKLHTKLNTAACTIPGSYSIDMRAKLPSGKQFSVAYVKRYDLEKLAERLQSQGWLLNQSWRCSEDFNFSLLALFQCHRE